MKNILVLLKSNILQLKSNKFIFILIMIGIPIILSCGAILSSESSTLKSNVAVFCQNTEQQRYVAEHLANNSKISLVYIDKDLDSVELLRGKYLAEIRYMKEGFEVISYKNNENIDYIKGVFQRSSHYSAQSTSAIFRIIGFLTIFLFMVSKLIMGNFLEERENGVMVRILMGQVSFYEYAGAQIIFNIFVVLIPTELISVVFMKLFMNNFNINILYYLFLVTLITMVGSSLSFCVFNCFVDKTTVEFVSSMVILLSSIFGGAIIDVKDSNIVIQMIRLCLPQKRLLNLSNEYGTGNVLFLVVISVALVVVGMYIGKKKYDEGVYL